MDPYFARQETLLEIKQQLTALIADVRKLMTEDAAVAAQETDTDNKVNAAIGLLSSVQQLLTALAGEQSLSPATLALITKTNTDATAMANAAQADVTADTPAPVTPPVAPS